VSNKLAIVLWAASPEAPHLCAAPFFHAAAAAAMDAEVEMYFTSGSVRLLAQGVAASLHAGPQQRETVYAFMQHAVAQGAKFYACSHAMEEYGVAESAFIPEVTGVAGVTAYAARSLDAAWSVVTY
jgi:uncharacterized protein